MSKKHFDKYYANISEQYREMLENIHELEQLVQNRVCDESILQQLKETIKPIKDSYMTISYVAYLLNLSNDKNTEKRNARQRKKFLAMLDTSKSPQNVIQENKNALQKVRDIAHE